MIGLHSVTPSAAHLAAAAQAQAQAGTGSREFPLFQTLQLLACPEAKPSGPEVPRLRATECSIACSSIIQRVMQTPVVSACDFNSYAGRATTC
jgi:hypothetical protein